MFWLLVRVIAFAGWAVILCLLMALFTLSSYSQVAIDNAYEREVAALRLVSLGQDPLRRLPQEIRGQRVAAWVSGKLDDVHQFDPAPTRSSNGIADALTHLPLDWWERFKPKLKRFAPVAWIRLETYLTLYLTCLPLYFCAFLLGEHLARKKIREGVHKRNIFPIWIRRFLWFIRDASVACTGLVIFLPVVWWVVPSIIMSCAVLVLWRAYSIQGLAFLAPGKV